VCDPTDGAQTTDAGLKFFAPVSRNLPANFVVMPGDMVPVMGGHAWDPATQPDSAFNWTEPVMVMGYYDNEFLYYEPMPPLSFVTGTEDKFWEQDITYENQDVDELATYTSVAYNATTGYVTFTFQGPSAVCNDITTEPPTSSPTSSANSQTGTGSIWMMSMVMIVVMAVVPFQW
jgi:hypothetical protein